MNSIATIPTFSGNRLATILEEAREYVLKHGQRQDTPRGETYSVKGVKLVWEQPEESSDNFWGWDKIACEQYFSIFVDKKETNRPERLAEPSDLLFPYTYAARSRYWDGGWGYVVAVIEATKKVGIDLTEVCESLDTFIFYLKQAGQLVHLQIILAVWDWIGKRQMKQFLSSQNFPMAIMQRSRIDQLEKVLREIEENPNSRRAITTSFVYPDIDQRFNPIMGFPPYQSFQILPAESRVDPLSSLHYHRSLDASDGVQLDFYHDYIWLNQVSQNLQRKMESICIVAGDFHVYIELNANIAGQDDKIKVKDWLLRVTDGYRAGQSSVENLIQNPIYQKNAQHIYTRLGD